MTRQRVPSCAAAIALALSCATTQARVTQFVVESETPLEAGTSYGAVGPYVRLRGHVVGELDPAHPGNAGIVNLSNAPRNANGMVEYRADVEIHMPADAARGNGAALYEVVNRGNRLVPGFINNPTPLLMEHGFTLVWSGWQGDIPRVGENLIASFPIATHGGQPIVGLSREEYVDRGTDTWMGALQYPAASLNRAQATLTVRERERDPRQPIDSWEYVNDRQIRVTPPGPPYDSGAIYEFIYPAKDPIVTGIGFAATRDINAFLRYEAADMQGNPNPIAQRGLNRHLALGISQSGRFLRDYLYQGFNADEAGRKVFDAVMPIIPGSRKTWVNFEFAQPGRWSKQHEEHLQAGDQFPFAYSTITDPLTGRTDGVMASCRASRTCPKVMHVDGEFEVWGARGSLLVSDGDPGGPHPVRVPHDVRLYMVAGTPHGGANAIVPASMTPSTQCKNVNTPLGSRAVNRALVLALDRWVATGREPPDSRYGNVARRHGGKHFHGFGFAWGRDHAWDWDRGHGRHGPSRGDLVDPDRASTGFPFIPGVTYTGLVNYLHVTDYSVVPPALGGEYAIRVPRVDRDGNSLAGIRLPAIEAPIATYTGWNVRAAGHAENENCLSQGSYFPFARTKAERIATGDPRPSIEERYRNRNHYIREFSHAAMALVREGYLLRGDAQRMIEEAAELDIGLDWRR